MQRINVSNNSFPATFWVGVFMLVHCLGWTLLPALTRYNLPLDAIEGTLWGQQLEWGYDKNPYLNAWLTAFAGHVGGTSGWLVYTFSQLSVLAAFLAVYWLGCRILNRVYALIAVLMLEGIQYYHFHAIDFNDNTLELGLWGLATYCFYVAMKKQQRVVLYWCMTGFFLGLALMAKYYTAALMAGMFCFMLSSKQNRRQFFDFAPYVGLMVFLAVTLPHIVWLFSHDFITVKYVFARGSSEPHWYNHLFFPAQFAWQQFEAFLPALILCLAFFFTYRKKPAIRHELISTFNWSFLFWVAFGPFALTLLLSFVLGTNLRAGWGMPLLSFWGVYFLAIFQPMITRARLYGFIATVFILMIALLSGYRFSLVNPNTTSSANFPGQLVANSITQLWHERYHTPLSYVAGSRWLGGNIAFYSKDHPRVFIEWKQDRAPWIDIATLQKKGAVFIWDISAHETLPPEVRTQFPRLGASQVLRFAWLRDNGKLEPVQIGVAVLPPGK